MKKKYIDGIILKEKTIQGNNGAFTVMNGSIRLEEFVASLQELAVDGWVNVEIKKRSQVSDKGVTHYMVPSSYKPKGDWEGREEAKKAVYGTDDLPF